MEFEVVPISQYIKHQKIQVTSLLEHESIRLDKNLDYTCGIFTESRQLIATGSCYKNSLRCIAVHHDYQGQGLMNKLITHLINYQFSRGFFHIFLYTKASYLNQFKDLGFYEIAYIKNQIVFMENKKNGFQNFLNSLQVVEKKTNQSIAALVMNCNPFTLGHQFLIEKAAKENDYVYLFIVEEDISVFPFDVRIHLVRQGVGHLDNVIVNTTGPYLISSATFPSYFQKDSDEVINSQTNIDSQIFLQFAQHLNINRRYVGTEPYSHVTNLYNQTLLSILQSQGIEVIQVPRFEYQREIISASYVRQYLKDNHLDKVKTLVPQTTYEFLTSKQGQLIINKLKAMEEVKHY